LGTVQESLAFIARHGYALLFAWVAAEQLGAPLPAVPILIAAGVLSATGQMSLAMSVALGVVACLIGDTAWYAIGKVRGPQVLRTLCRISLEPESCVRRSSEFLARYGARALTLAKFIPGISTVAVPLAANSGVKLPAFFFYDFLGSVLYVGAYIAAGRLLGDRVDRLDAIAASLRSLTAWFVAAGVVAILAWRYWQRRKFTHDLVMARITPLEVLQLIEQGGAPYIVDLRHPLDMLPDARMIPGAVRMTPDELTSRQVEIPRDREIILYCT
jgi:membrane protein DedA with SNARE-associated domain